MSIRSKSKIFRLTELQLEQLEKHLEKEGTTFTDFIHSLIQREVMQDAVTVKRPTEEELKNLIENDVKSFENRD